MKTVTIKISGMHCAACSNGVERSLKKVAGVDRAEVNLATQSALVRYDENQATMEQLEEAVTRMSFGVIHDSPGEESTAEQSGAGCSGSKETFKSGGVLFCAAVIFGDGAHGSRQIFTGADRS